MKLSIVFALVYPIGRRYSYIWMRRMDGGVMTERGGEGEIRTIIGFCEERYEEKKKEVDRLVTKTKGERERERKERGEEEGKRRRRRRKEAGGRNK